VAGNGARQRLWPRVDRTCRAPGTGCLRRSPRADRLDRGPRTADRGPRAAGCGVRPGNLYSATKWAVAGLAQSIRAECVGTGVRVTLIQPGLVDTGGIPPERSLDPKLDPADIARAVLYAIGQPAQWTSTTSSFARSVRSLTAEPHRCAGDLVISSAERGDHRSAQRTLHESTQSRWRGSPKTAPRPARRDREAGSPPPAVHPRQMKRFDSGEAAFAAPAPCAGVRKNWSHVDNNGMNSSH
jgi:hypothetical protein